MAPVYAAGGRLAVQLAGAALLAAAFAAAVGIARRLVPEPWATAGVLVAGLSPPAVLGATTISSDPLAAALLTGAAALALLVREEVGGRFSVHAFWAALLVGAVPWAGLGAAAAPAAVSRWPSAAGCAAGGAGWPGFAAIEVVLFSLVTFVSAHGAPVRRPDALRGARAGRPPDRGRTAWPTTSRAGRGSPGCGSTARPASCAGPRSRSSSPSPRGCSGARTASGWCSALPQYVDVEVTAGFLLAACAAQAVVVAFLAPELGGAWPPGHGLLCVAPLGGALCAWALRRVPRHGRVLAALTVVATVWTLAVARVDGEAGVAPPRGPLPWGGAERVLPGGALR